MKNGTSDGESRSSIRPLQVDSLFPISLTLKIHAGRRIIIHYSLPIVTEKILLQKVFVRKENKNKLLSIKCNHVLQA